MKKFNVFDVTNVVLKTLDDLGLIKNILALFSWRLGAGLFSIPNYRILGVIWELIISVIELKYLIKRFFFVYLTFF